MALNSFAAAATGSNRFTRKFGTDGGNEVQPYLSGRGFIEITGLPSVLPTAVNYPKNQLRPLGLDIISIKHLLEANNLSLTPPGKTVNTTEFTGLGGITWGVPTNVQTDGTISLRFLELANTPILSIFHGWTRLISDSRAGVSLLVGDSTYTKQNYACNIFYWTTQPDGITIDYSACFTGAFPLKDPSDLFGYDLASIDKVEIDMDFRFDYMFEEPWVYDACNNFANTRRNSVPISTENIANEGIITAYRANATN